MVQNKRRIKRISGKAARAGGFLPPARRRRECQAGKLTLKTLKQ
ncbi:hypothetical protein DCCM_0826 [Desulfocucumis palustris]|uniref:Uncharacterized protein n=1 Tax=Desulfocucumis palustris TaxID=1898651 RepID=A0A2L2X9C3_9FIRM|nr:hypothetical protein DCCM_0826 [Desulfocucumis palustris]